MSTGYPPTGSLPAVTVYVVCRHGNDSQLAVQLLQKHSAKVTKESNTTTRCGVDIRDIVGGLSEWTDTVDPLFPKY